MLQLTLDLGLLRTARCIVAMLICHLLTLAASEIQMMTLPHTQYVIAEASTPVSGVNSSQVKTVSKSVPLLLSSTQKSKQCFTNASHWILLHPFLQTHYVISEGQAELETKQSVAQNTTQAHTEHLEEQTASQPTTTQYIITTTTNGSGASEVHITKPWNVQQELCRPTGPSFM